MAKNNIKPDLLTQFFDHSSNYKNKRSRGYFKFLRLQKKQQFLQFYNQFYMNFIFRPYKIALANVAILLVMVFSFASFGFGLITQAQNNPGASFIPTDTVDTTRLDDCNLDIALPKKIDGVPAYIYSTKSLQNLDERYQRKDNSSNFSFFYAPTNNSYGLDIDCYNTKNTSGEDFITAKLKTYNNNTKLVLKQRYENASEIKKLFTWKIFSNSDLKNTRVLKTFDTEQNSSDEYLVFEVKNFTFIIRSSYSEIKNVNSSPIEIKNSNTLDKMVQGFDINYNENSDFVVSKKIIYDENGSFSIQPFDQYSNQVLEQSLKRMLQFFGILGIFVIVIILACNYILNKKIKPKASLQTKIRLLLASYGLIYLIFVNTFNAFASQVDFLYKVYNYHLDIAAMLVIAGLSLVVVVFNWKKLSKKTILVDLAFLFVYILYVISLIFSFAPFYSGDGTVDIIGLIWLYTFPAIFTLSWVSYAAWNGYLAGKQILLQIKGGENESKIN